ncbi:Choline dehydrogenase [Ceratobasidium theobromae]|uniref:Choline dehydrogenase n=1 Tax=Ceratobasidium theobromae TaxID=1582974 RepID=A0A5N5QM49_9AGAM|nr:Choline dehydrogenase [Ceratobasidium theobromae]
MLASISVAAAMEAMRRGLSPNGADFSSKTYDYIIVGGGTAGLAVAARLSEDPKTLVGVIEAGQYLADDDMINTPGSAFQLQGNANYDWMFKSTPQAKLNNRVLNLPRLIGDLKINIMVFDRASKIEYDAWATFGNPGWDWNGLLPFMKAAEHFIAVDPYRLNYTNADPNDIFSSQGTEGPIAGGYNNWYSDLVIPFGRAMKNLCIPTNFNPDSGDAFGTFNSPTAVNRTTGRRSYAATTYYAYNAHRPNFVVLTGAQATRIELKKGAGGKLTATGVSFVHNSTKFSVKAKKEVILSTGSFQTPQLLELSGIGNATILRQFGIAPLVDLPGVGENLQDHLYLPTTYELKPGSSNLNLDMLRNDPKFAAAAQAQYTSTHDGPLASSGSIVSFINLNYITNSSEIANITTQLNREIALDTVTPLQEAQYKIQKDWLEKKVGHLEVIFNPGYAGFGVPKANTTYISLLMALQHPFSRGNIHISSSDPLAAPQIDPKYFSKSIDQRTLVQAIKFGLKVSKTEPLASIVVARQEPAPDVLSDDAIIEYIKANVATIYHPIGTAVIAPRELGGVVDSNLKVYGTSNLRVVDASIIPIHMGTHLQRTVYGIAEKAASIIKKPS